MKDALASRRYAFQLRAMCSFAQALIVILIGWTSKGRTMRNLLLLVMLLSAVTTFAQGPVRGGSNYYFYQGCGANCGNGYGILTDFYLTLNGSPVNQIIYNELSQMTAGSGGQRSISILIFFRDAGSSPPVNGNCPNPSSGQSASPPGSAGVIDSSTGAISPNCLYALNSIIYAAYYYGFQKVRVRFMPQGPSDPFSWSTYDAMHATQNWNFIQSVVNGIQYGVDKYDLGNEEIYNGFQPLATYTNWLWTQWVNTYGLSAYPGYNTVGFSIPCDDFCANKLASMSTVYNVAGTLRLPPVLDLHIYGSQCPGQTTSKTAYQQYGDAYNYLASQGWGGIGWIIGETCFNDSNTASMFQQAMSIHANQIYFIQQWFADLNTLPTQYNNWAAYNF
jgi:hypothetical protein